jgi:hypothetical protein
MAITFDTLAVGGDITIENPDHPYAPASFLRQIVARRDDGSYVVTRIGGDPIIDFTLTFRNYNNADKETLDTWINDEALYAANPFTYTDPDAANFTNMRLLKGTEDWTTSNFDNAANGYLWNGTLFISKDLGL